MDGVGGNEDEEEELGEDGKPKSKNIMVLAATNRPWDLDEAMIWWLEKWIYIPLPEETGWKKLFEINTWSVKVSSDVELGKLVSMTKGYSGADIANVCWEAALMPMRRLLDDNKLPVHELPKYKD